MAQLRAVWPEVERAIQVGHKLRVIHRRLNQYGHPDHLSATDGLPRTPSAGERKDWPESAQSPDGRPPITAGIDGPGPGSKTFDPLFNFRAQEKKRVVWQYPSGPPDEATLLTKERKTLFTAPRSLGTTTLPTPAREDFPLTARDAAPFWPASRVSLRCGKTDSLSPGDHYCPTSTFETGSWTSRRPGYARCPEPRFQDLSLIPKHSMPRTPHLGAVRVMMRLPESLPEVSMLNLLTESDIAERLHVSLASVRRWRLEKRGPTFVKVGALVRYRPEDLEAWVSTLPTSNARHESNEIRDNRELSLHYSSGRG